MCILNTKISIQTWCNVFYPHSISIVKIFFPKKKGGESKLKIEEPLKKKFSLPLDTVHASNANGGEKVYILGEKRGCLGCGMRYMSMLKDVHKTQII